LRSRSSGRQCGAAAATAAAAAAAAEHRGALVAAVHTGSAGARAGAAAPPAALPTSGDELRGRDDTAGAQKSTMYRFGRTTWRRNVTPSL
jgi:hypothetical protein